MDMFNHRFRSACKGLTLGLVSLLITGTVSARILPGEEARFVVGDSIYHQPTILPESQRRPDKGLLIRNIYIIDGTGSPPYGPVDIRVDNDRITAIKSALAGAGVGVSLGGDSNDEGIRVIDGSGKYVMPGFIDAHVHTDVAHHSDFGEVPTVDYVFKLWLGHGITTVRDVGAFGGLGQYMEYKELSEQNAIIAPRMKIYPAYPMGMIPNPETAANWVKAIRKRGADGVKLLGGRADNLKAVIETANSLGMKTAFHHPQVGVNQANALDSALWGNASIEHWYGIPEAMFEDKRIQRYSLDYNYSNEQDRFGEAGTLWAQTAKPGSERWNALIDKFIELNVTLDPTLSVYEANRDLMAVSRREWFDEFVIPAIEEAFQPNYKIHGSYFFDWTTQDEINWKNNFNLWMAFVNDFKNRGGRVTVGSDAGFIYNLFGFGYVRGLEMLQEAGFHPLEVMQAATLNGAELLGMADEVGTLAVGKKADMVIVEENPLTNFKLLYGTGHTRLNLETHQREKVGGVLYTIKDGVVYDAKALLEEVKATVRKLRAKQA
ncbi:amidohydrolase family protein [Ferrimonas gelatinilytica]|uniref:Amidohydrolase-related domain-containing protein n=1 Tax=Ferrimonas gelatinilytica TaxID=1255257 RepID=A0ABP9S475_9GAMM